MKRIVIDARMVNSSGIGRYLRHILEGLRHDDRFRATLLGNPAELQPFVSDGRVTAAEHRAPLYSIAEQLSTPLRIPACDLFFSPHYVIPLFYRGPLAVTIHDVIHLEDRAFAPGRAGRAYARLMLGAATRRARRVFTVSEYTARRIVELVGADRSTIRVIPNGVDPAFFQLIPEDTGDRVPYILFVGNAKRHKNLRTLIRAFAALRGRSLPHELVIAGATSGIRTDLEALQVLIGELKLEKHVRFVGHVPDADLPGLYHRARLLVLPSLVEGFGLPPLEAMACGTAVVVSDRGSLPEVCGDAAEYYTPAEDPEALADAMLRVLGNDTRRAQLIASGRRQARRFASDTCARRTLDALYEA